ncbi:MAG TPA: amino acid permease [Candidatus Dormibacteraeota bacterium]|jgi:AAT family amino acid transporter|nr:amino acid permease [Candidatus Dormibacteraeota bacterium]
MTETVRAEETPESKNADELVRREAGLQHQLSPAQVAMIALGSTIGTGLFLTSAISVKLAGPAVVLSFAIGAIIALTVMWALAEMAVEHPAAGSFGLYAEMYLHPWAGFATRYTYWLCLVIVIGSEVAATSIYCKFWFPNIPSWLWISGFSVALVYLNTLSIKNFGTIEFWFAMIKVVTIAVFLILGTALVLGFGFPRIGTGNFTSHGGFFPNGWKGVGLGVTMAIFSFLGLEIVGVSAGEAADPKTAVPRAFRRTLAFLALFYLGGLALVVAIVPWEQIGLDKSPFVTVFEKVGIPAASHIMNFVVLTAALSSALCNLYFTARLLFSLSRGNYAPALLGKLGKRGMPVAAVLASSLGMAAAMVLNLKFKDSAFFFLIGVAFFGGPFIWLMTLVTHMCFRHKMKVERRDFVRFAPPGYWSSLVGLIALIGVLISTWWVPDFHVTLLAGPPWLAFLTLCYFIWREYQKRKLSGGIVKND